MATKRDTNERPSKHHLMLDARPNSRNVLRMLFVDDTLHIQIWTKLSSGVPFLRRLQFAFYFVFGLDHLIPLSHLDASVVVKSADYGKVLSVSTVAYLRNIQLKKAEQSKGSLKQE